MKIACVSKIDFDHLLQQFKALDSVRFETFCEIWKNLKMSYILSGIETTFEMRQLVEDCMRVALEYCSPDNELQDRIGGLYILYALYYKQPLNPPARIRVRGDQWNQLKVLLEEMKEQQHLDAEYIFTKLRGDKAFQLTATSTRKMLIKPRQERISEDERRATEKKLSHEQEQSILSDIMEPDTIGQLSALHEQYHQMKCYLSGKDSSQPEESLSCIKNNLVQNITKSVASFEEYRRQKLDPKKVKARRRKDSGTTSESEGDSDFDAWRPKKKTSKVGDRRASLKEKAFSMPVANRFATLQQRKDLSPDKTMKVSDSGADESEVLLSPVRKQSDTEDESSPRKSSRTSPMTRKDEMNVTGEILENKSQSNTSPESSPKDTGHSNQGRGRGARVRGMGIRTRGRVRKRGGLNTT